MHAVNQETNVKRLRMFCLFDTKAQAFAPPFCTPRVELAVRSLIQMLDAGDSQLAKFPEDFVLYEVGVFDDTTGVVESVPPVNHGPVSQWKGNGHV